MKIMFSLCALMLSSFYHLLGQTSSTDTTMTLTKREKDAIVSRRNSNIDLGRSTTTELKCQVLNTNFTIPLIRFNTVTKNGADNNQKGNVALFNSVGAGISYNWGRMTITTDADRKVINTEMQNTFGF